MNAGISIVATPCVNFVFLALFYIFYPTNTSAPKTFNTHRIDDIWLTFFGHTKYIMYIYMLLYIYMLYAYILSCFS